MKKPVMKTAVEIQDLMKKRKRGKHTVNKRVPSGTLANLIDVANDFAVANDAKPTDIKVRNSSWGGTYMEISAPETDEQFFKRLKSVEYDKYRSKKYEYDRWSRQQAEQQARIVAQENALIVAQARTQRRNSNAQCCPSNCCCRRS